MPNYKGPVKQPKKPYYDKDLSSADAQKKYYNNMLVRNVEDMSYKAEGMLQTLEYHKDNDTFHKRDVKRYAHSYDNFRLSDMVSRIIYKAKTTSKDDVRLGKKKLLEYEIAYVKQDYIKGRKLNALVTEVDEFVKLYNEGAYPDMNKQQYHTELDIFERKQRVILGEWSEDENTD